MTPEERPRDPEGDWKIIGSRKRRAGIVGAQIVGADGQVIGARRPGRPRKHPVPGDLFPAQNVFSANVTSQQTKKAQNPTQNLPQSQTLECEMSS